MGVQETTQLLRVNRYSEPTSAAVLMHVLLIASQTLFCISDIWQKQSSHECKYFNIQPATHMGLKRYIYRNLCYTSSGCLFIVPGEALLSATSVGTGTFVFRLGMRV